MKIAKNNTNKTRYSVIQTGPTLKVIGHYQTRERADAARGRHLSGPWGSGVGPIVQIHKMAPGEFLTQ